MTPVQETPQIFTLVLALSVLASLVTFLVVGYRAIRGRRPAALRLLGRWAIAAAGYLAISAAVSWIRPTRIVEPDQNWCFDEWCIAVEAVHRAPSAGGRDVTYTLDIRIYNDARSPEGVRGFWAYLRDGDGHRYAPAPGAWKDVVATRVPPHGLARTSMAFLVPSGAHDLGFVTGHGIGTPCALLPSLLEIGQGGCLFHQPDMIRVQ
jgi:hypothetical protein